VHVAAVEADHQRHVGARKRIPVARAGVDEAPAFVAHLVLQALGHCLGLSGQCGGVQAPAERQDLADQPGGQAVGGEPGELCFQVGQLGCGPLDTQRGERAEGRGVMGAAVAVPPAGTSQVQRPVQAVLHDAPGVLVPVSFPVVRTGRLGGQGGIDLLVDQGSDQDRYEI